MLVITKKQMDTISGLMLDDFIQASEKHLKGKFPETTGVLGDQAMNKLVREGIDRSAEYKIHEPRNVLNFLEYLVCFGWNFENDPAFGWAKKLLRIRNISGSEKMYRLMKIKPPSQQIRI
jgi:hypothetical protein